MLPSAVVNSFVKRRLMEELPLYEVPSYIINSNSGIQFQNVLAWKEHIPSLTRLEVFVWFESDNRTMLWAIRDIDGDSFEKLKEEHFKYTTEQALLRLPFENGAKDILFNLDIIDGIFKEAWDQFNGIFSDVDQ